MIEEKEAALEQRKAELLGTEEETTFNEEEWLVNWDTEHPLPDIISEVVDEFDRDIDE